MDGRTERVTVPAGETAATVTVTVPGARLWWPAGYGDQPLYGLAVTLGVPGEA
ncbi:hypothetical protein LUW77_04280 [Streptomyces radiopugnans]|nr:hypothetical protein LUW77_04280 [Streptomyces radiopugnans]